jgi:N-acetylneuraminate synthase
MQKANINRIFVIAEAGSNWKVGTPEEDLARSKQLIETAKKCGADAIKFQTYRSETIYAHDAGKSDYLSKSGINNNINEIFEYYSMPYEIIPKLSDHCKQIGIEFMSTPFSVQDAKQIDPFVSLHKIASYEINHVRLLEFLAKTKKPILISTGASTYEDIDFAVNLIKKNGNNKITLLQCTSKYPCPISALNLSVIPEMQKRYQLPIGFSDHSMDPIVGPLLAIGYGATVIEKHFTLDRGLSGPDHPFALVPEELKLMIKNIRDAESAMGDGKKEVLEEEKELAKFAKRSLQAINDIKKGEILVEGKNFDVLRPGNRTKGIDPKHIESVNGKKATSNIAKGDGITGYY